MKEKLNTYAAFLAQALSGLDLNETNRFLRKNYRTILEVADLLYGNMKQEPLYRGVIFKEEKKYLRPQKNFTFISTSDDRRVAESFGDPTETGFQAIIEKEMRDQGLPVPPLDMGGFGFTVVIDPPYTILFHHSLFNHSIFKNFLDRFSDLKYQREVIILQPPTQLELIPFKIRKNPRKKRK